jgi:hypothetical protein
MHGATAEEKNLPEFIQAVKDLSIQYQKPVAFNITRMKRIGLYQEGSRLSHLRRA